MEQAQIDLLNARLAQAEEAYHDLCTGQAIRVLVDQNGDRVEYTAATRQGLWAYILLLKSQLNNAEPVSVSGPAGFIFR